MSFYEKYFLPKFLDFACNLKGFQNKRSQIVPNAFGTVLEIGIGSGLNLEFYDFDKVCLLYTSPSPRDRQKSRMPSSA